MKTHALWVVVASLFLAVPRIAGLAVPCLVAGEIKARATLKGHTGPLFAVAFSPDGKTLASASQDNTIKLWDVETAKNTATLKGHTLFVASLAFDPNGKTLASGGGGETIKVWDVTTGKAVTALKGHAPLAYSPDGKILASGNTDRTIKLWDVPTAKKTDK